MTTIGSFSSLTFYFASKKIKNIYNKLKTNNRTAIDLEEIEETDKLEIKNILDEILGDELIKMDLENSLKKHGINSENGCIIRFIEEGNQCKEMNKINFIPEINDKWQESQAEKSLLENKPENNLLMIEEIKEINHEGKKAL